MKRNIKQRLGTIKRDIAGAAEKAGDMAEDAVDDIKGAVKRGRSKLKKL